MLKNILDEVKQIVNQFDLGRAEPLLASMLLSDGPKTCMNMAYSCMISHDVLQRILALGKPCIDDLQKNLLEIVKMLPKEILSSFLIVDDTTLARQFAKHLEGLGFVFDSAAEEAVQGYKIVLICWSNQKITIPICFKFWRKEGISVDANKTKLELAKEMLTALRCEIDFDFILLDGLYASEEMMQFFEKNNLDYYMRLPRNRKVRLAGKSISFQIGDSRDFRLPKNLRSKTFYTYFGSIMRYVTAQKRKKRNGTYETVFIVSNVKNESSTAIFIYSLRWAIEKAFRTMKQILGLNDCRARTLEKQELHIYISMTAYAILEQVKLKKKFKCPEDSGRFLKKLKDNFLSREKLDSINILS